MVRTTVLVPGPAPSPAASRRGAQGGVDDSDDIVLVPGPTPSPAIF